LGPVRATTGTDPRGTFPGKNGRLTGTGGPRGDRGNGGETGDPGGTPGYRFPLWYPVKGTPVTEPGPFWGP